MASNRLRSLRNIGNRMNVVQERLGYLDRRPSPRRLSPNFIIENNIMRAAITTPLIADNAVTEDTIGSGAVNTDQIAMDAINGKNITSCTITDSTIDNCTITTGTMDGTNITTGTMDGTVITNVAITLSTLDGEEVVATGITLSNCVADAISPIGGGTLGLGGGDGVSIAGGSSSITVAGTTVGIAAGGSGITFTGFAGIVSVSNFLNFTINGKALNTRDEYLALANRVEVLEIQMSTKADAGHSH